MFNWGLEYLIRSIISLFILLVYNKKSKSGKITCSLYIAFLLCMPLLSIHFSSSYINICMLTTLMIFLKKLFQIDVFKTIIFISMLYLYIFSIELLLNFIFYYVTELDSDCIALLSYIVSQLLFIVVIFLFEKLQINLLEIKYRTMSLFIIILFIVIAIVLVMLNAGVQLLIKSNYTYSVQKLFFIIVFISILIITLGIVFYSIIMYNDQMRKNIYIKDIHIDMQNVYVNTLKEYDKDFSKFRHDINNHISTLAILLNIGEINNAIDYLNQIHDGYYGIKHVFETGNNLADIVINHKYTIAKEKNIKFDVKGSLPNEIKMKGYDFSTILFNLLDNAIEANDQISGVKYIYISLGYYNDYMSIKITNPSEIVDVSNTSKKDKKSHGFGIANIKSVLDKYSGDMKIKNQDDFNVDIVLKFK